MKAIKNHVEIAGMRNAHVRSCDLRYYHFCGLSLQIRDAIALCEYFAWLEREVPKGQLTELSAAHQLELYRRLVMIM